MNARDLISWPLIAGSLAAAEDALARLDERLRTSPVRDGFLARADFTEACASLWREGELVLLEDLVLHDAGMDVRTPTHELVRAHAVLTARRRIVSAGAGWALSEAGIARLRGRESDEPADRAADIPAEATPALMDDEAWSAQMAEIDALVAGAGRTQRPRRDPLLYDRDFNEEERLAGWRAALASFDGLPPVLAAALALESWLRLAPLEHAPWLGFQLAAALLVARGKARSHLPGLALGLRALSRERRWTRERRLTHPILVEAISAAALTGLKEHDRLFLARQALERRLAGRRATSSLPALIELAVATPILSANLVAKRIGVTPRAAQSLVAELGLREMTGRGRYRAWGIV